MLLLVVGSSSLGVVAKAADLPVLIGMYPHGAESSPSYTQLGAELSAVDTWLQSKGVSNGVSIAATFSTIETQRLGFNIHINLPAELNAYWSGGYVPFVNLMTRESMAQVANGSLDTDLAIWMNAFKIWLNQGGGRRAFIAPFPEMNGSWTPYGEDPASYKKAMLRLQSKFRAAGIADESVSWVFAPNSTAKSAHDFEKYYPGDAVIDVVGFSSYNFGSCPTSFEEWKVYENGMKPFLDRMRSMAPGKPIFVVQTATVKRGPNGDSEALRSAWVEDVFTKLAAYPGLRAIIYFNKREYHSGLARCLPKVDFRIFRIEDNEGTPGFAEALKNPAFGDWEASNADWSTYAFPNTRPSGLFADVWPAHPFSGKVDPFYLDSVNVLKESGITGGCGVDPLTGLAIYCPEDSVSRDQMAVFLEKGMQGSTFIPPMASGTDFNDVPSSYWSASWIEQLAADGVTGGCAANPPLYCPKTAVTRAQMAVFLEKASHYPFSFIPPGATGVLFNDVSEAYWASSWIEQLATDGITGGCSASPPLYCPNSPVTRGQMAVFLVKTFGL
jgi:hypothetical protein